MSANTLPATRGRRAVEIGLNAPLIIGGLLVLALLGCALAAPLLAPYDPLRVVTRFNGSDLVPAPYPPGTQGMPLGSDIVRRDMLSRLIYGGRYTLLFCGIAALVRVGIGGLLGMLAGWYPRASRVVDVLVGVWSSVPSLVFAMIPIALVNRSGSLTAGTITFVVVLSLTGWAETAVRARVAVQSLRGAPFVESAYVIGLRRKAVLWRHVLPNMRDLLLVEFSYAIAAVLLLIAELSFLNLVLGGSEVEIVGTTVVSTEPIHAEWGSMLARGLRARSSGAWLFLEPMMAFTLSILAFNLLAEGLRRRR